MPTTCRCPPGVPRGHPVFSGALRGAPAISSTRTELAGSGLHRLNVAAPRRDKPVTDPASRSRCEERRVTRGEPREGAPGCRARCSRGRLHDWAKATLTAGEARPPETLTLLLRPARETRRAAEGLSVRPHALGPRSPRPGRPLRVRPPRTCPRRARGPPAATRPARARGGRRGGEQPSPGKEPTAADPPLPAPPRRAPHLPRVYVRGCDLRARMGPAGFRAP